MEVFDISPGLFVWALVSGLFIVVVPAVLGAYLAARRHRNPILGFFAGFVLSWIGIVLILLIMAPPRKNPTSGEPPDRPA